MTTIWHNVDDIHSTSTHFSHVEHACFKHTPDITYHTAFQTYNQSAIIIHHTSSYHRIGISQKGNTILYTGCWCSLVKVISRTVQSVCRLGSWFIRRVTNWVWRWVCRHIRCWITSLCCWQYILWYSWWIRWHIWYWIMCWRCWRWVGRHIRCWTISWIPRSWRL